MALPHPEESTAYTAYIMGHMVEIAVTEGHPSTVMCAYPKQSVYAGYRYYDKAGVPVRWSFGYGLSYTSFAYYDLKADGTVPLDVSGEQPEIPGWQKCSWYESCQGKPVQAQWEAMLGQRYEAPALKKGQFTMECTVEEMKEFSLIMKIMYKAVEATVARGFGGKKNYENLEFRMLMASSAGSPLRSMQISAGMKDGLMQGLLEMANGHFLRGIWKMVRG